MASDNKDRLANIADRDEAAEAMKAWNDFAEGHTPVGQAQFYYKVNAEYWRRGFSTGAAHVRDTELREMEANLKSEQANYRGALSACNANSSRVNALEEENARLRSAIEELRDAACTAVNWQLVIAAQVGDAPWISQGDANDVELAVLKANEALYAGKEETK
jgi:hypothetical protein